MNVCLLIPVYQMPLLLLHVFVHGVVCMRRALGGRILCLHFRASLLVYVQIMPVSLQFPQQESGNRKTNESMCQNICVCSAAGSMQLDVIERDYA